MKAVVFAVFTALSASFATMSAAATVPATDTALLKGNVVKSGGHKALVNWVKSLGLYETGFKVVKLSRNRSKGASVDDLTVSYDSKARNSGSWSWGGEDAVSFVVFNAPNDFVAQHYLPGIFGNDFDAVEMGLTTKFGGGRRIRHITVYGIDGVMTEAAAQAKASFVAPPEVVPLPAGGLLLFSGLGLIALRRRKAA